MNDFSLNDKVIIVTGKGSFTGTNTDVYITFSNGKPYLLDIKNLSLSFNI